MTSRCSRCRQRCVWPLGSLKHDMWMHGHDCRLLRPVETQTTPGQPGKDGGDHGGLAGRGIAESSPSRRLRLTR